MVTKLLFPMLLLAAALLPCNAWRSTSAYVAHNQYLIAQRSSTFHHSPLPQRHFAQCTVHRIVHSSTRCCVSEDPQSATISSTLPNVQDQLTEKLRVDKDEQAARRTQQLAVLEEYKLERRRNTLLAVSSSLLAAGLYALQRANPADPAKLLKIMESESLPLPAALDNGRPTLVEFYAPWCESCKLMAGSMRRLERTYGRKNYFLQQLASNRYTHMPLWFDRAEDLSSVLRGDKVNFVVLDGDDPRNAPLVRVFRVDGIPHMALITPKGTLKDTLIGMVPPSVLEDKINALMRE